MMEKCKASRGAVTDYVFGRIESAFFDCTQGDEKKFIKNG